MDGRNSSARRFAVVGALTYAAVGAWLYLGQLGSGALRGPTYPGVMEVLAADPDADWGEGLSAPPTVLASRMAAEEAQRAEEAERRAREWAEESDRRRAAWEEERREAEAKREWDEARCRELGFRPRGRDQLPDYDLGIDRLARQVRFVPKFVDGQTVGLKLFAIRCPSPVAFLGFENDDVLTTVNGEPPASEGGMDNILTVADRVQAEDRVTVELLRDGDVVTLTVDRPEAGWISLWER